MDSSQFLIQVVETEEGYILRLIGSFGLNEISYFHSVVGPLAAEANKKLCLHLEQMQYIDSSGLGAFVSVLKKRWQLGTNLDIIEIPPKVQRLFQITGIAKFIRSPV